MGERTIHMLSRCRKEIFFSLLHRRGWRFFHHGGGSRQREEEEEGDLEFDEQMHHDTLGCRGEGFPMIVRQCSPLANTTLRDVRIPRLTTTFLHASAGCYETSRHGSDTI
ncbi:hypothetical protein HAX54_009276 [Datura stramonium]|uniref:Uncharacterized protein n=1 Tax=Datura stramonium TaxID=4076 RepID=A0ABS8RW27_DATST|nr:hypothetical protein [Datura stramonium]